MAILKCKMCGGDIELSQDKTFGTCEFCGSTMTFPKELLGEQAMRLLHQILQGQPHERVNLIKTTPVVRSTVKKM